MATVGEMIVKLGVNSAQLTTGIAKATTKLSAFGASAVKVSATAVKSFAKIGVAVGAVTVAIGVKAVKGFADFEKQMANVSTLLDGDVDAKVNKLSDDIKNLATTTGASTDNLTDGLYQVISAFGDTAVSMEILNTATKSSVAGNATVTDSVNLLSAVMKGYGDVSKENAQHVSDLAFMTVKLGQTTFPELASSMGAVIPMANQMGVSQEELFASMATLTGVTGNTSEVATQLRSALKALAKPTAVMSKAIIKLAKPLIEQGKISGKLVTQYKDLEEQSNKVRESMSTMTEGTDEYTNAEASLSNLEEAMSGVAGAMSQDIIKSEGLVSTLGSLMATADGNNVVLTKMFGRVEGLTAGLALTGSQADVFAEKFEKMGGVVGATDEAFARSTDTFAFKMDLMKQKINTSLLDVGEKILPNVIKLFDKFSASSDKIFEGIGNFVVGSMSRIIDVVELLSPTFVKLAPILTKVFDLFMDAVEFVLPYFNDLVDFLATDIFPILLKIIEDLKPSFGVFLDTIMDLVKTALPPLLSLFGDLVTTILPALVDLFASIVGSDLLPALLDLIKKIVDSGVLGALVDLFSELATTILGTVVDLIKDLVQAGVLDLVLDLITQIVASGILPVFVDLLAQLATTILKPVVDLIKALVDSGVLPKMLTVVTDTALALAPFVSLLIELAGEVIGGLISTIGELARVAFPKLGSAIDELADKKVKGLTEDLELLTDVMKTGGDEGKESINSWRLAVGSLSEVFANLGAGIRTIFYNIESVIVDSLNTIIDAMNIVISLGANKLFPGIGTLSIIPHLEKGFDPKVSQIISDSFLNQLAVPGSSTSGLEIPAFANGGIVTKPTVGLLGDSGSEVVIPLNQMGGSGYKTANITIEIDGQKFAEIMGTELVDYLNINGVTA